MKKIRMVGIIIIMVLIIDIVLTWITYFDLEAKGEEVVKCYDKYGNELIGQECIDYNDNSATPMFITLLLLFAIALVSPLLYIDIDF